MLNNEMPVGLVPKSEDIIVQGKADLHDTKGTDLSISGKTGAGIAQLLELISANLSARVAGSSTLTHQRHRNGAVAAIAALQIAQVELAAGPRRTELVAENLRQAIRALDMLVGRIGVENLLDEIFLSFCIGK